MRGGDKQNYLFDPPTSRKVREPGEGDVETGRGKKGKKAGWHLTLGLKEAIFAGIGIVGLLMMSFTLGTLAGRGDIYRVAYSWGLLNPEARQAAQIMPQAAPAPVPVALPAIPATPEASPAAPAPAVATPAVVPAAAPPAHRAATAAKNTAKSPQPVPISASIAPVPAPAAAASTKKRAKSIQAQEQKAREDHLRQTRLDVAKKLTFLNSFDSTPKTGQKKEKSAAKPQPTLVKVGTYRDSKSAKAKMAELQKQGVKASLKQGKDAKGVVSYTVYRQAPAHVKEAEKLAQSKDKEKAGSPSHSRKTQAE